MGPTRAAAGPCDTCGELRDGLEAERDQRQQLQTEHDALTTAMDELQSTVAAGPDAVRGEHLYDAATRETVGAVGLEARPGMVFLEMTDDISVTTASAWFVDEHLLLTNNHNIADVTAGTETNFWTIDGERHGFEVVGGSAQGADIALLRTEASAPKVLPTEPAESVAVGDELVQVGNPGGFGQWVLTLGELVEHRESWGDIVTTVPGRQGVSGSSVLNFDGEVSGLTYAGTPVQDKQPDERPIVADPVVTMADDGARRDRRRDYQPDWQSQGWGEVFETHPDRCPDCGHESFRPLER